MSKRYYLCDIIGDGSDESPFRPAVADHVSNWAAIVPPRVNGVHTPPYALVIVATKQHGPLQNINGIDPLPDYPADAKLSAMHKPTLDSMRATLSRRGISSGFADQVDGYRETLRGIGRTIEPNFDENNFDVAE